MARYSPSAVWAIESEISCSIAGSREIARRRCSLSTWGMTMARPSAWRAYSASSTGSRVTRARSPTDLDDGAEIADRDALPQQGLQDALDLADGEQVRHYFLNDSRVGFLEPVEQRANVLSREQLGDVAADRLGEVGDDDRLGVDHRVAQGLGLGAGGIGDPHRGQAEGGLGGRDAGELADGVARVQGELVAGHDRAAGDLVAAHLHHVLVRAQRDVVVDAHRRDDRAEVGGDLAAHGADAGQQRAARAAVDERHEAEADRQLDGVDRERLEGLVARGRRARAGRPRPPPAPGRPRARPARW